MAIASFRAASGIKSSISYCFRSGASIIGSNVAKTADFDRLTNDEAKQVIQQVADRFAISQWTNPQVEKNYYHTSISLPLGESLDDQAFAQVAYEHAAGMVATAQQPELANDASALGDAINQTLDDELDQFQLVVFRHTDKPHQHVHYLQSRIHLESGIALSTSNDRYHSQAVMRVLEKRHGLEPQPSSWEKKKSRSDKTLEADYRQSLRDWIGQDIHYLDQMMDDNAVEIGDFILERKTASSRLSGVGDRLNLYRTQDFFKRGAKHGRSPSPVLIFYDDGRTGGSADISYDQTQELKRLMEQLIEQVESSKERDLSGIENGWSKDKEREGRGDTGDAQIDQRLGMGQEEDSLRRRQESSKRNREIER